MKRFIVCVFPGLRLIHKTCFIPVLPSSGLKVICCYPNTLHNNFSTVHFLSLQIYGSGPSNLHQSAGAWPCSFPPSALLWGLVPCSRRGGRGCSAAPSSSSLITPRFTPSLPKLWCNTQLIKNRYLLFLTLHLKHQCLLWAWINSSQPCRPLWWVHEQLDKGELLMFRSWQIY